MKLLYDQIKGRRTKSRGFYSVTTFGGYWWVYGHDKWMKNEDIPQTHQGLSSHFNGCRSVRAFRRRLRQWSLYLPKGVQFILVSRWGRNDVYGRTS